MCNEASNVKRISALGLQAAVMATLVRSGVDINIAEPLSSDLVHVFANSEVAHPCWSAHVLGEDHEHEETNETQADDEASVKATVMAIKVGPNGIEVSGEGDTNDLPAPVRMIMDAIVKATAGK